MSFDKVDKLIKRPPVLAGMDRMQPEMRTLANELLARFAEDRRDPLPAAQEGAAMALWGAHGGAETFLDWHRERGLATALEVLLAATGYERVMYEWDSSIWALRRARPAAGFANLGPVPWLWMREQVAKAKPAERKAALEVARTARSWLARAACAFAFPDDDRWSAADEAELRYVDEEEHANVTFGVLVAMRGEKLDHKAIRGDNYYIERAVPPELIAKKLGDAAVAPLRLLKAWVELAAHPHPDALRALAEFADFARDELAAIEPSKDTIAALAPMFTKLRPRRTLGLQLARALLDEHVVAQPKAAEALAKGKSPEAAFIARVIAETGASVPADDTWSSPWTTAAPAKKPAAKAAPVKEVAFTEKIHWKKGEREKLLREYADQRAAADDVQKEKEILKDVESRSALMLDLHWMTDKFALRLWKQLDPKKLYGQVDDVQQMAARFGLEELATLIAYVRAKPETLAGLANVESPRVAPLMARGFALLKKHQATGKAWLDRFPEAAAIGLFGAEDADKKQRDANDKALAYLSKAHAKVVENVAKRAGAKVSTAELQSAAAPVLGRKPKLPPFVQLARLPRPIRNDGKAALAGVELEEFVMVVKATLLDPPRPPVIDAIAQRYTPASLARFAWALFRQWLFASGPPKEKWAHHVVGKFPDDDHARSLGKLARRWAPGGNPTRAQEAVEVLALMRTQTALIEIYDISRKVQSKALKARAEVVFETVATQLGISAEELADRLVPELSEQDLTFGDQRVELDGKLEPRLATAPEGDDAKRFKELQKLCRAVGRGQLKRLEQAMAEGHRMPFEHFAEVYLMHSLIRHLARGLVWGCYRDGALDFAFAIDDGGVDVRGKPLELPLDARYGVVHPVELTDKDRAAWAKRVGAQPFPQLEREVFAVTTPAELQKKLAKFAGRTVPTAELLGLQRTGWRRGDAEHRGTYFTMHRAGDGWTAELAFNPGIYLGRPTEEQTQILEAIAFRAEGKPPPSILSDLQRDLAALTAR